LSYESELKVALKAVIKACDLCRSVQAGLVSGETIEKKDRSPVTVADFGAQAIVIHNLKQAFPNDPVVAEEDAREITKSGGEQLRERILNHLESYLPGISEEEVISTINQGDHNGGKVGRFWTLDPIDGTKGFLRKEQYAVALALIEEGEVVLGVLGCPNLSIDSFDGKKNIGAVFHAIKGQGAYMKTLGDDHGKLIRVSNIESSDGATFCESVESSHSSHSDSARIAEILNVRNKPVRIDSQCKYGVLARGEASIYLRLPTHSEYEEKIWDHAAGYIVVREAGGEVTDCFGKKLDFSLGRTLISNTGIVGSNGKIHGEVLEGVKKVIS